mgnify:CR=1 FL=1
MPGPTSSPHGIGSIITNINKEYQSTYNTTENIFNDEGDDLVVNIENNKVGGWIPLYRDEITSRKGITTSESDPSPTVETNGRGFGYSPNADYEFITAYVRRFGYRNGIVPDADMALRAQCVWHIGTEGDTFQKGFLMGSGQSQSSNRMTLDVADYGSPTFYTGFYGENGNVDTFDSQITETPTRGLQHMELEYYPLAADDTRATWRYNGTDLVTVRPDDLTDASWPTGSMGPQPQLGWTGTAVTQDGSGNWPTFLLSYMSWDMKPV